MLDGRTFRSERHRDQGSQPLQAQPQQRGRRSQQPILGQLQGVFQRFRATLQGLDQVAVEILRHSLPGLDPGQQFRQDATLQEGVQKRQAAQGPGMGGAAVLLGDDVIGPEHLPHLKTFQQAQHPAGVGTQAELQAARVPGACRFRPGPMKLLPVAGQALDLKVQPALLIRPPDHFPASQGLEFPDTQGQERIDPQHPVEPAPAQHPHDRGGAQLQAPTLAIQDHGADLRSLPAIAAGLQPSCKLRGLFRTDPTAVGFRPEAHASSEATAATPEQNGGNRHHPGAENGIGAADHAAHHEQQGQRRDREHGRESHQFQKI